MGIKNLNSLISNHTKNAKFVKHLSHFSGKIFAIDTYVYLYKFLYGKNNHINGLFFMINKLKKFNITPIFIFDGKPPAEKNETLQMRREIKNKLKSRLDNLKIKIEETSNIDLIKEIQFQIEKIEKRIIYINKEIIDKSKRLLDLMGIMYINADCEAEHYCSKLCKLNIVDGVISEDMDTVACGSKIVLRNYSNRSDSIECIYTRKVILDLNINYKSFVDLCILLGTDYNPRPNKISITDIIGMIQKYKKIENLIENNLLNGWNCNFNDIRNLIYLDKIQINKNELLAQVDKNVNLPELKLFLKKESKIEKKIYLKRINLIYFCNTFNNYKILNNLKLKLSN